MKKNKKECFYCQNNIKEIDYWRADQMRNFLTYQGKIRSAGRTGLCSTHQRKLNKAVKRARHLALLPFVRK